MSESRRHLIKKYANRKLYDTRTSRYITLEGISDLVRDGHDIQVVDRESGRDITPLILSQIVTSEEKRTDFDNSAVSRQERGQQLLHYVRDALNVPAALVGQEMERRRGELESIVDVAIERAMTRLAFASRRDVEKLNRRIDDLSTRLDKLNGGHPRRARAASSRS